MGAGRGFPQPTSAALRRRRHFSVAEIMAVASSSVPCLVTRHADHWPRAAMRGVDVPFGVRGGGGVRGGAADFGRLITAYHYLGH